MGRSSNFLGQSVSLARRITRFARLLIGPHQLKPVFQTPQTTEKRDISFDGVDTFVSYIRFKMIAKDNTEIREKMLSSAESLFAQHGYNGTSLRKIVKAAQVNLAAVNYHFDDKETLFCSTIRRRLRPINEARLAMLGQAGQSAGAGPVPLEVIIDLLARPLFELGQDTATGGHFSVRLLGRCLSEPQPFMTALMSEEFHPVMARFAQAIRRHVPTLSPEEFLWRFSFVVGAMHHTLTTLHCMKELTQGICRNDDHEGALRRFTQFAVAAFLASSRVAD